MKRIGYFGDGPWAHLALERLLLRNDVSVGFVCARFDNPDPVLASLSQEHGIRFFAHPDINSPEFLNQIELAACDLFVSMSFNQIFKKRTFELPPLGTINCHAGKLPFYRGRNILNWALINDESEFGITAHYVDEGIDTGDIIRQEIFPITDKDNYASLLERAYHGCADVLDLAVGDIVSGCVRRQPQIAVHPHGFYCSARIQGDERLSWNQTSRQIFNFVRAICFPGPSARCYLDKEEIRINKVTCVQGAPDYVGIPGAIVQRDVNSFYVKTLDSFIRVDDWVANVSIKVGDRLV